MTGAPLYHFAGRTALVLHRSADVGQRISARCDRLGIRTMRHSGDVDADRAAGVDMVILDIDIADDGQLPWPRKQAAVPVVGLIGSESPSRLAWALGYGIDGYLPLSALGNLFSALVIAHETFAQKTERRTVEAGEARRNAGRLEVIRAVLLLMEASGDEALALKQLRAMAMVERLSLEDAARRLLAEPPRLRKDRW